MTARTNIATGATIKTVPSSWADLVADYSAVGDGVTDNTVAIQTALNDLKAEAIETLYVPKGNFNYKYLVTENTYGWQMQGAGPNQQYQTGPSRLCCTGAGGIRVRFTGAKALSNQALITINTGGLTGHAALTGRGYTSTWVNGGASFDERQDIMILATGGTYTLTFGGQTTSALAFDATPGQVQTALQALSSIGSGNATCSYAGGFGFMIARSTNFTLSGIGLDYSNSNFGGDVLAISGEFNGTEDCQDFTIERCGTKDLGGASGAQSGVYMSRAIIGSIERSHFLGGLAGIRLGAPDGNFINNLAIEKCTFNGITDAQIIVGSDDLEMCTVRDCCFEAGINTTAIRGTTVAVDGGQNQTYNMVIENNWFGDSAGGQKWIDSLSTQSNAYTGTIAKNRFAGVGGGGTHLTLDGKWLVYGNTFENGTVFKSNNPSFVQITSFGNLYNVSTVWDATSFPSGAPDTCVEFSNASISKMGMSSPIYMYGTTVDNTQRANLIIAPTNVDPGTNNKAALFYGTVPGTGNQAVFVQAPWTGSGGDGLLTAGAGPNAKAVVQWRDQALGFFGATPAGLYATAGTSTGFTTGAGTGVKDDSTFTGGVGLSAPFLAGPTPIVGGGTFAAGTYYYKVTALNAAGETLPSNEQSVTVALNGRASLLWTNVVGATSYKVYRATSAGAENVSPALVATVSGAFNTSYTDTGAATSAGAVPGSNTAITAYRISDIVLALKTMGLMSK